MTQPSQYIEKLSLATGEVLDEPIDPKELLVNAHRDRRVIDVTASWCLGRLVAATGNEALGRQGMRALRRSRVAKLIGLNQRKHCFRYKKPAVRGRRAQRALAMLQQEAAAALTRATGSDGRLRLRVLLTGGTGFLGKEILWQAAHDPQIAEMIVLIRPKQIIEKGSGKVIDVLSPQRRGEELVRQLSLDGEQRRKVRFIAGDVEQPNLGISAADAEALRRDVTHVIHCAANVAFDDPYEASFKANVGAAVNALTFSRWLQDGTATPFAAHLAIETSYVHGRRDGARAAEGRLAFPRGFFNNYYELTKAMASLETQRFILEQGLRAVELCPAIVIGAYRTGNNRGDTKVVNAPINLFGMAKEQLARGGKGALCQRLGVAALARIALAFPADATAELNLVPVDWVAQGIMAALKKPEAIGQRIHLATDTRVNSTQIQQILREELQVEVRLSDPTLHRNLVMPLVCGMLKTFKQERMGRALQKLGSIFAGYSEWGQPVHEVGRDVSILGLPAVRPVAADALRMLCRHNQWVQEFGKIRDADEIAHRETIWAKLIGRIERDSGRIAAHIPPHQFRGMLGRLLGTHVRQAGVTDSGRRQTGLFVLHSLPSASEGFAVAA
jgi:nucleoside-diphosphate-sugar epimerase